VVTITATCYSWAPSRGDHLHVAPSSGRHKILEFFIITEWQHCWRPV